MRFYQRTRVITILLVRVGNECDVAIIRHWDVTSGCSTAAEAGVVRQVPGEWPPGYTLVLLTTFTIVVVPTACQNS